VLTVERVQVAAFPELQNFSSFFIFYSWFFYIL
jgi:hypothetical protein